MESCLKIGGEYRHGLGALLYKMGKISTLSQATTQNIDRNCDVLPKTSNIHSRRMVLLHEGWADDNGKRRERASDDGAA